MRFLISLFSFVCALLGFDPQPGTSTVAVLSQDGIKVNSTKVRLAEGKAKFECLQSASGQCHYVVYLSDCAAPAADPAGTPCTTTVIDRFTLVAGKDRESDGVPAGARVCASHDGVPVVPHCDQRGLQFDGPVPIHAKRI